MPADFFEVLADVGCCAFSWDPWLVAPAQAPFGFFLVPLGTFFYGQFEGQWPVQKQRILRRAVLAAAVVLAVAPIGIGLAMPKVAGLEQVAEQLHAQTAEHTLRHARRQVSVNECQRVPERRCAEVQQREKQQPVAAADGQLIVDDKGTDSSGSRH